MTKLVIFVNAVICQKCFNFFGFTVYSAHWMGRANLLSPFTTEFCNLLPLRVDWQKEISSIGNRAHNLSRLQPHIFMFYTCNVIYLRNHFKRCTKDFFNLKPISDDSPKFPTESEILKQSQYLTPIEPSLSS